MLELGTFNIDARRIGIWGSQYGGLVAGLALTYDAPSGVSRRQKTARVLRCGATVEPLAELQMHTALFTERFMGYPNERGYANASLVKRAAQMPNNALLIVHGESNWMMSKHWSVALEMADVRFEQYDVRNQMLQYDAMEKFFDRCLCALC